MALVGSAIQCKEHRMTTKEKNAEQWLFLSCPADNYKTGHPKLYGAEITVHKSYRSLKHTFKKFAKSPDAEMGSISSWNVWQNVYASDRKDAKASIESYYCFSKDGDVMPLQVVNSPEEIDKAIAEKKVPVQLTQHHIKQNLWHVRMTDLVWYVDNSVK